MAYPASFHRLVIIWDAYGDKCNTTLAIIPAGGAVMPAVSDSLLASIGGYVAAWWALTPASATKGLGISSSAKLTSVKLNRINTAGHYQDAGTKEHVLSPSIAGPSGGLIPPQLSVVGTLRGVNERAHAGKGRMYLPITAAMITGMASDGRLTTTSALEHANGVASLVSGLIDLYISAGVTAVPGIASKAGAGAFQGVNKISVGRVIDTMRSRRNKLVEAPVHATGW